MKVTKFTIAEAAFERSPGQDGDIFTGNLADERHGGLITVGYGRYGPDSRLETDIVVDDVMIVLEGRLTVTSEAGDHTAGPGDIVYMPKGNSVTILAHAEGAVTAYVTYPHWRVAES